jgi:hypothetical protein
VHVSVQSRNALQQAAAVIWQITVRNSQRAGARMMQLSPASHQRDPVEDCKHVIGQLQADGTVDKASVQVRVVCALRALAHLLQHTARVGRLHGARAPWRVVLTVMGGMSCAPCRRWPRWDKT